MKRQGRELTGQTAGWAVGLTLCVALAVLLGIGGQLPRRFGIVLALASFASGAALGLRGFIPVYVSIAVFGATRFVSAQVAPPGGEDQTGLVLLYFSIIPALFAVPTATGALARRVFQGARRRR